MNVTSANFSSLEAPDRYLSDDRSGLLPLKRHRVRCSNKTGSRTRRDGGTSRAGFGHAGHRVTPMGIGVCGRFAAGLPGELADGVVRRGAWCLTVWVSCVADTATQLGDQHLIATRAQDPDEFPAE